VITKTVTINASACIVWQVITDIGKMKVWMAEPEMDLDIFTTWEVGSPMIVKGFHHVKFENKGKVLTFDPEKLLRYNYISSISRLPDSPENYTVIEFALSKTNEGTRLTVTASNYPTESIFKHVEFYWAGTTGIIKKVAEELGDSY